MVFKINFFFCTIHSGTFMELKYKKTIFMKIYRWLKIVTRWYGTIIWLFRHNWENFENSISNWKYWKYEFISVEIHGSSGGELSSP